jgi:hypothetical protein
MDRKEAKLYTAWWFQKKDHVTIDVLDWRVKSLINDSAYRLINVTSHDRAYLKRLIGQLIEPFIFQ